MPDVALSRGRQGGAAVVMGQVEECLADLYRQLKDWVNEVAGEVEVSLMPPTSEASGRFVGLYLTDFMQSPPPEPGSRLPPLQLSLRFLVTAFSEQPEEAHRILCALAFSALGHAGFELELEPIPAELWMGFGLRPRPAFRLTIPLRLHREEKRSPRVRSAVEIQGTTVTGLNGLVVGPGSLPVVNARVELPAIALVTRTDVKGRFWFASVPAEPRMKEFRIQAKSEELTLTLPLPEREEEPLIINFDVLEI